MGHNLIFKATNVSNGTDYVTTGNKLISINGNKLISVNLRRYGRRPNEQILSFSNLYFYLEISLTVQLASPTKPLVQI